MRKRGRLRRSGHRRRRTAASGRRCAADYDRALTACGDAATVVFAAELPRNSGAMRFRRRATLPRIYILNAVTPLDEALKRKLIAGYTILDEKADFENRSIPGEYEAAFATRYRLVTAAN